MPEGKLVLHIFAALAEFERSIIRERTTAGVESGSEAAPSWRAPTALDAKGAESGKGTDGPTRASRQPMSSRRSAWLLQPCTGTFRAGVAHQTNNLARRSIEAVGPRQRSSISSLLDETWKGAMQVTSRRSLCRSAKTLISAHEWACCTIKSSGGSASG
jgi:hypothetical protein